MPRLRLIRSTSFRLAAIYLVLFTCSVVTLGAFVYLAIRNETRAAFEARIVEEDDALKREFDLKGRDRLIAVIEARSLGSAPMSYGLIDAQGRSLAGELAPEAGKPLVAGWNDLSEAEPDEIQATQPELVHALALRLGDGAWLLVGDEWRRSRNLPTLVLGAFSWALAIMLALGVAGGLWLSARFVTRIEAMSRAARDIMAGDWRRRIPEAGFDDDLSSLASTFNRMFDRLEKLFAVNRDVSANIAHDLRKPMAHLLRRLEAMRDDAALSVARPEVEAAIGDVEGVLETFEALLSIGQIEAGARRARFTPLDLSDLAREVVEAFGPAAEEEGKTLVARLDEVWRLRGDRELLVQMIANVVDNAIRHTERGARIEVSVEAGPKGPTLVVADNGPGVAPADLPRLFDRFFRADASRATPGAGLGLSLVAAVAELHDLRYIAKDNGPGLQVRIGAFVE